MKSNFFFANSAVSSIFLTPVSKLISLREELVNKLDMIDVVCVLSSRDPEADSRLYDTLLLTRDLVGYIEQEINRRGIQLMYVGIEKGNEGKSAVELLNMEDEDFQVQAYSILDILDFEALKRVEAEIKKVLSSNPPLYRPYMEEVRQQLQKRTVLLN